MSEVTRVLDAIQSGNPSTADALLPLIYDELRRLASDELQSEEKGNTLQPTALVHEVNLRLVGREDEGKWNHRGHFYGAAARAMRQKLVESARRKKTLKQGGDGERLPLDDEPLVSSERHPDRLKLDAALDKLAVERPDQVELVSLRFAGLTMDQAAKVLGISKRSTERNWIFARAWLLHAMQQGRCHVGEQSHCGCSRSL